MFVVFFHLDLHLLDFVVLFGLGFVVAALGVALGAAFSALLYLGAHHVLNEQGDLVVVV